MRQNKKLTAILLTIFSFLFILIIGNTYIVNASIYQSISSQGNCESGTVYRTKLGGKYYWIKKDKLYVATSETGKGKAILTQIDSGVTDGKNIYYGNSKIINYTYHQVGGETFFDASGYTKVYKYNIKTKKKKKIRKINKVITIVALDKKKIYYSALNKSIYSMNLKCNNRKKIKKTNDSIKLPRGNGRYIIRHVKTKSKNYWYTYGIKIYNTRTKKEKTITKNVNSFSVGKDYIYFTEKVRHGDEIYENAKTSLYRYSFSSGKTVKVTDNFMSYYSNDDNVLLSRFEYKIKDDNSGKLKNKTIYF